MSDVDDGDQIVGRGLTVFQQAVAVEGVARWLDSPQAVMDFVLEDGVEETIVVARGGTTTFLVPALTAGVKGIVTLRGTPESHLGIVSREYGIPCVMGATFTAGVRTERDEIVPADGARLRLDIRDHPEGRVLSDDARVPAESTGDAPAGPSAEELEQIQALLANYRTEIPHGPEGDRIVRGGLATDVMTLTDESLRRDLTAAEYDDWAEYAGWHMWDCLSQRVAEGESGLIPRQEYESVAFVQVWQRYPQLQRLILERVGIDGLIEIGATARREIGTKVNILHAWAMTWAIAFGRGTALELGLARPDERPHDVIDALQFGRRLYAGMWDDEPMLSVMRGYRALMVGEELTDRFHAERTVIAHDEQRRRMQRINASAELLGFLLHFDNRCGMADSGPYPTPDGGFMILRDHFVGEDAYSWSDVVDGLPYAITQAMYFAPDVDLEVKLLDLSTLFTTPANYLPHLSAMAVYARDRWDTPMDRVRLLDDAEIDGIASRAEAAAAVLYRRVAAMTRRERIMAGVQVYYTDFLLPFARAAGVWDELVTQHDFHELDPVASEAYYKLTRDNVAQELIPRLFITGTGYQPLPADAAAPDGAAPDDLLHLPALHRLALRGSMPELPGVDVDGLVAAELVARTRAGYMLTGAGRDRHAELIAAEDGAADLEAVREVYQRFHAVNGAFKKCASQWHAADEDARFALLDDLERCVERAQPVLARTAVQLPRFATYPDRLSSAMIRASEGEFEFAVSPTVDSVHTVWMEVHEDYLQTLGISREAEGSY